MKLNVIHIGCLLTAAIVSTSAMAMPKTPHKTSHKTPHIRTLPPEPEIERQVQKYPDTFFIEGLSASKRVAFTFDDGPNEEYTPKLLEILKKNGIKATFFWLGRNVEKHPEIAKAALADGHTIGNHTYGHPHSRTMGVDAFWTDEVERTQDIIRKTLGITPSLFRPPYGELNDDEIEMVKSKGLKIVAWSIDPKDWSMSDDKDTSQNIVNVVKDNLHPEAIVLMHDGMGDRGANTVKAVEKMIPALKAKGYKFVTIDRLLSVPAKLEN